MKIRKCKAFTLAEVLITLVIIGVIAAMTVPTITANSNKEASKAQFKKAVSTINGALQKTVLDLGFVPECYYARKKTSLTNSTTGGTGAYHFADCEEFMNAFYKNVNITKKCKSAYAEGCTPHYEGTITGNCSTGFSTENIKTRNAYILNDGMIFIPYVSYPGYPVFAIDINGMRKPNKGGHDLFPFMISSGNGGQSIEFAPSGCRFATGKTSMEMYKEAFANKKN